MEIIKKIMQWIKSNDKFAHFICNFLIVVILGIIFSPVIGLAAALVASFSKEIYDEFTEDGSGWDWKDVLADAIGITAGLAIL